MKFNDEVEALIRVALSAAVHRDASALTQAVDAFGGDYNDREIVSTLVAITAATLVDLYHGKTPTEEQLRALASAVAHKEEWSRLDEDQIYGFLRLVSTNNPDAAAELQPQATGVMLFVVPASLLAGRPMPKGQWWYDYLDQIEQAIEAADA